MQHIEKTKPTRLIICSSSGILLTGNQYQLGCLKSTAWMLSHGLCALIRSKNRMKSDALEISKILLVNRPYWLNSQKKSHPSESLNSQDSLESWGVLMSSGIPVWYNWNFLIIYSTVHSWWLKPLEIVETKSQRANLCKLASGTPGADAKSLRGGKNSAVSSYRPSNFIWRSELLRDAV